MPFLAIDLQIQTSIGRHHYIKGWLQRRTNRMVCLWCTCQEHFNPHHRGIIRNFIGHQLELKVLFVYLNLCTIIILTLVFLMFQGRIQYLKLGGGRVGQKFIQSSRLSATDKQKNKINNLIFKVDLGGRTPLTTPPPPLNPPMLNYPRVQRSGTQKKKNTKL